ncbi:MFS general substrate transporter [Aulographum hederae CBS 113979]|uniref:MFS general substrate transporter n=1 Tax=Aulographum hederae CBS 113979 TaxID=1176131 RepID=A0A6G1GTF2_9PEZI|nr:MFS general substrate transporter [Aulographum hederae CBS 113979]
MDGTPQTRPKYPRLLNRIFSELGLVSLYQSHLDTKLLCLQRFVRLFAYGGSTLILVSYLSALQISDREIGLFMTLTLVGDVLISFLLTLIADGLGRRTVLALGAALMIGSGVVFGLSGNFWVLLAAAILGVISPSGNEIGPFRAIEESTLAHLSPKEVRPDVFAWYSLLGTAGSAFGLIVCGWVSHTLQSKHRWHEVRTYRTLFFAYAALGSIKFILACMLSKKCEAERENLPPGPETAPLLSGNSLVAQHTKNRKSIFPTISSESRAIFSKLSILFALDSFASGLAPLSWITSFFHRKFHLQEGYLGSLFFTSSIIAALSMLVAASLARRIGNIKTMVFTHLPSSIFLSLMAIPNSLPLAMTFLILRACTQSMDTAPRTAFLAAMVLPNERTAVMGAINVIKTSAQSLGPLITGILAGENRFWVAFVTAGVLKVTYDLGMLAVFVRHESREETQEEGSRATGTDTS